MAAEITRGDEMVAKAAFAKHAKRVATHGKTAAGFDGVMAKPLDGTYVPDRRVQFKIKHHRSADCVVAGYRLHKDGGVGALLLGLVGDEGEPLLHHIGVCSAFSTSQRRTMLAELEAQQIELADHPWAAWADA